MILSHVSCPNKFSGVARTFGVTWGLHYSRLKMKGPVQEQPEKIETRSTGVRRKEIEI